MKKEFLELISGIIYQLIVLLSVITIIVLYFLKTGTLHEFLSGALVGVMVGLPMAHQRDKGEK